MKLRAYYRKVGPDWIRGRVQPLKCPVIKACLWLRTKRTRERLRPTFLIVGVGKAGTTSLFLYLVEHPKIAEPLVKEISYFNRNWDRPLAWYLAHFPRVDRVLPGTMTGEASPGYMFNPENPAARIATVLPDVKIIVLLRNPVFRAISHYYHDINRKIVSKPRGLLETLLAEGMELRPELTNQLMSELGWDERSIAPGSSGERWPPVYIRAGLYAEILSNWLKYFDRDRMLILKSENLFADPRGIYAQTLSFLGLDFFDLGPMKAHNVGSYSKVDPRAVRYLSDIYADPNRRLHELLGEDFGWDALA